MHPGSAARSRLTVENGQHDDVARTGNDFGKLIAMLDNLAGRQHGG